MFGRPALKTGYPRLPCCAPSTPGSRPSAPPGCDDHLQAVAVRHTRGLLGSSSLHAVQGLLLLGPDPQLGAAGPALRRGAHRPRPQLHVLPGESAAWRDATFFMAQWGS